MEKAIAFISIQKKDAIAFFWNTKKLVKRECDRSWRVILIAALTLPEAIHQRHSLTRQLNRLYPRNQAMPRLNPLTE